MKKVRENICKKNQGAAEFFLAGGWDLRGRANFPGGDEPPCITMFHHAKYSKVRDKYSKRPDKHPRGNIQKYMQNTQQVCEKY